MNSITIGASTWINNKQNNSSIKGRSDANISIFKKNERRSASANNEMSKKDSKFSAGSLKIKEQLTSQEPAVKKLKEMEGVEGYVTSNYYDKYARL